MTDGTTRMRLEINEIPAAAERLLTGGAGDVARVAAALRERNPAMLVTIARGTSDHACTYLKYAVETVLGLPVASLGPSIASVYGQRLRLAGAASLSVSQSGQSPDIVQATRAVRDGGALSVAITNRPDSPLVQAAELSLDMRAGPEIAVAATKSFVNSLVGCLMLVAECAGDEALRTALRRLPGALEAAIAIDWPEVREGIGAHGSMFTLGRGHCLAISAEAALKFKETCFLHAESYSAAEVLHGPVAVVQEGFPVLAFASDDAAEDGLAEVSDRIAALGGRVFATTDKVRAATAIDAARTGHPLTDALCLIASFYSMVERLAVSRGINPDAPRNLRKVTETV